MSSNDTDEDFLQNIISNALNDAHNKEHRSHAENDNNNNDFPSTESEQIEKDNQIIDEHNTQDHDFLQNVIGDAFKQLNTNSAENNESHAQDNDLENAIGDAFGHFGNHNNNNNNNDDQDINQDIHIYQNHHHKKAQDEFDLNNAIGEAFKDIEGEDIQDEYHEYNLDHESNDDFDLQNAIGDAFKNIENAEDHENDSVTETNDAEYNFHGENVTDQIQSNDNNNNEEHHDDFDLQDAIGEAFKSIDQSEVLNESNEPEKHDDEHLDFNLQDAIGEAFKNINDGEALHQTQDDADELEMNLQDAIGEAFKNIEFNESNDNKDTLVPEGNEDDHLQDAIGEAFKNIESNGILHGDHNQVQHIVDEVPEETKQISKIDLEDTVAQAAGNEENHDEHIQEEDDESNLQDAIGEAFKNIQNSNLLQDTETHDESQPIEEESSEDQEQDHAKLLEDAISDAFKEAHKTTEAPHDQHQGQDNDQDMDHDLGEHAIDLADVIGDAFQAAMSKEREVEDQRHNTEDNDTEMIDSHENNMEEAIEDALRAAFNNTSVQPTGDSITNVVSDTFKDIVDSSNNEIDVSGVVHNIINQMSDENFNQTTINHQIPDEILHNLAQELTSKIQNEDYQYHDPVNEYDQNEYEQSNELTEQQRFLESETGLDQSQLDQILQNAFALAMEQPQEDSFQIDRTESDNNLVTKKKNKSKKSDAANNAALNQNIIIIPSDQAQKKKKALSIAETLALSRSSMRSGPMRDYSSIESINDVLRTERAKAKSQIPRTSTSSTANEKNLVKAIKQMTDALFKSNLSNESESSEVNDDSKVDESNMVNSLMLAKQFLSQRSEGSNQSGDAIGIINNALRLYDTNSNNKQPVIDDPNIDTALIDLQKNDGNNNNSQQIRDQVNSHQLFLDRIGPSTIESIGLAVTTALSNFKKQSKSSASLIKSKPEDLPEIKERIRLDNRERKKRWREENSERNKDNDLRCRVQKRANALFGEADGDEKKSWFDIEFKKRRDKRLEKKKTDDKKFNNLVENISLNDDNNDDDDRSKNENRSKSEKLMDFDSEGADGNNELSNDPNLIKSITSIFNIFNSNSTSDTVSAITATATATAATAAIFTSSNKPNNDTENSTNEITLAISSIIQRLLNNTPQSSIDNVAGIPKGVVSSFKIRKSNNQNSSLVPLPPSKYPDAELTSLVKNKNTSNMFRNSINAKRIASPLNTFSVTTSSSNGNPILELQKLSIGNFSNSTSIGNLPKRKNDDVDGTNDTNKRARSVSPRPRDIQYMTSSFNSNTIDDSNIDPEISGNTSSVFSNFKLPQYKKRGEDDYSKASTSGNTPVPISVADSAPTPSTAAEDSQAIIATVNSISKENVVPKPKPMMGLKKPGMFQRPSYSKPKDKGKSLGFPRLLSSSFQN